MFRPDQKNPAHDWRSSVRAFGRDEDGNILIFGLFAFVMILMVGGIAVDMMRYESERVRLQGTADRAALAAATLRQTPDSLPPEDIVRSYFEAEGASSFIDRPDSIVVSGPENARQVLISPQGRFETSFMRLSAVDHLAMNLGAGATESVADIRFEIVMVVDVSYSMYSNERIQNLRSAAREFVELMLPEGEDVEDTVAITFVPYSTEVLMPQGTLGFFENLSAPESGDLTEAFCVEFDEWDTVTNSISTPMTRRNCAFGETQQGHLPGFSSVRNTPIKPFVRSRQDALDYIDLLGPSYGTSIDLGVRAGALFFDPTLNPIIRHLVDTGDVDDVFEDRPFAWNEPLTFRALILMTDGENCCFPPTFPMSHPGVRKESAEVQDADTVSVCDALKAQNVTIYSVAFEAPPRGVELMEQCASAPSFFFNSSGTQLVSAFRNIARNILTQTLRLTQ